MKLRTKTWTVVLAAMVVLLVIVLLISARAFLAGFERIELEQAALETERVLGVLERQCDDLERTARDYAEWNDTIAYAAGGLPQYEGTNLSTATLSNLQLQFMLIYDRSGRPAGGGRIAEPGAEAGPATPEDFAKFAGEVATVLADSTAATRIKGFKRIDDVPWMFVSAPLTTPDSAPGPHGALVAARPLDESFLADLTALVQHPVLLHPPTGAQASTRQSEGPFTAIPGRGVDSARAGATALITHAPLRAPDGTPVAIVHVELPRSIHQQAARTGWLIVAQVAGTALFFGVLFSVLLSRFVVGRIEHLHRAVQRVGREHDLAVRVPADGRDEIASLGRGLNAMLDALARGRAERDEAQREREKLQEQLLQAQKMEAIGEFAGGIAHDFNNCLTSITGWLSLVRQDLPKDSEHREHLGLALASAHHASAVVNQLLVYSRQGKPTLAPLSLRELLANSLQLLRSGLPRTTELQLSTTGDDDVVLGDNTQIQQVVMNLVKNAADAMDRRGRVTIALDEITLPGAAAAPGTDHLPPGRYARLVVRDTGPGIPPHLHERIFEPFFTTKGAGRGNGLGLAVVRSVVLRHNGGLGLASPPGEGATFFVYLPIHDMKPTSIQESAAAEPARGGRVLVVDDDPNVRQIVATVVAKSGYEVVTAVDGQDGWDTFERSEPSFDAVLTDLTMPRLGGMQLGERIFNSGRKVPVLLMTAFAATLDREQLRRAGFAALVAKPLDLDLLKEALASARKRA